MIEEIKQREIYNLRFGSWGEINRKVTRIVEGFVWWWSTERVRVKWVELF